MAERAGGARAPASGVGSLRTNRVPSQTLIHGVLRDTLGVPQRTLGVVRVGTGLPLGAPPKLCGSFTRR